MPTNNTNSYVTWKWLVGALLAGAGAGAGAFATLKSDVAVLEQKLEDHERADSYRHTLQEGTNTRTNDKVKQLIQHLHRMELRQVRMEERIVPKGRRIPMPPAEDDHE